MNARTFNHARKKLERLECAIAELTLVSDNLQHTPQLDVFKVRQCLRNLQQQARRLSTVLNLEVA